MPAPDAPLHVPMGENDAEASTVGEYLIKLLAKLWADGEDMVKRPFGNSGWQYEVYRELIKADLVEGKIDEFGDVDELDTRAADALIQEAIAELGRRL